MNKKKKKTRNTHEKTLCSVSERKEESRIRDEASVVANAKEKKPFTDSVSFFSRNFSNSRNGRTPFKKKFLTIVLCLFTERQHGLGTQFRSLKTSLLPSLL